MKTFEVKLSKKYSSFVQLTLDFGGGFCYGRGQDFQGYQSTGENGKLHNLSMENNNSN